MTEGSYPEDLKAGASGTKDEAHAVRVRLSDPAEVADLLDAGSYAAHLESA